jgi:hypothetical protein
MERAHLFKYLFDMSLDEITSFIAYDETVEASLYKLDMAARTRHIIDAVQIEDMWQALDDESQTYDIYLSMRLSPMTLASCFHLNHDMNGLEWRFVFPRYDDLPQNSRPKCFGEYLALNKNVQIVNIESYDIDIACEFLDKAYDFSHHKSKPIIPRQPGGATQSKP